MHTPQQNRRVRKKNELPGRCRIRKKRKEKTGATLRHANGFLKQRFSPVMDVDRHDATVISVTENSFYRSLKNLARVYKFEPLLNTGLAYPLNIRKSFRHAQSLIEKSGSSIHLIIYQDFRSNPSLATVRELDTNLTLYYIPIDALWKLHIARNEQAFCLLLSIYAYICQETGMPLFNDDNYVGSSCDYFFEMIEEDNTGYDEEELAEYRLLGATIHRVSPILNKAIADKRNLELFESRISSFDPRSDFEKELLTVAKAFLNLMRRFPGRYFMENLSCGFLHFDEDDYSHADQYFSFCWTTDGWLMENLESYVNSDLQERSYLDQPCSVQNFSKRQTNEAHPMDFHYALMKQLNLLVETLNNIP
jgi:hypothetical protein